MKCCHKASYILVRGCWAGNKLYSCIPAGVNGRGAILHVPCYNRKNDFEFIQFKNHFRAEKNDMVSRLHGFKWELQTGCPCPSNQTLSAGELCVTVTVRVHISALWTKRWIFLDGGISNYVPIILSYDSICYPLFFHLMCPFISGRDDASQ